MPLWKKRWQPGFPFIKTMKIYWPIKCQANGLSKRFLPENESSNMINDIISVLVFWKNIQWLKYFKLHSVLQVLRII